MNRQKIATILLGCMLCSVIPITAQSLSSPNYIIEEDFVGGGGTVDSSSPNYRSQDSIGAPAVGDSESANNKTQSGATTTDDPMLEFSVSTTNLSLGSLLPSLTRTGTSSFSVRNYTSSGYVVQVLGSPPTNGSHALAAMTSPAASATGTEQFGINLVANSSPVALGADPAQVPNGDFSYGIAASGYDTANAFKYASGDVIARANESSGRTDYTISYIANISNATPGGVYVGTQTLVCTGTY
ncbi:hypothetical protein PV379_03760 [Streptomyces caniscabiei]|uniref:hypothetical protein n=1 Tax=Streptomyces caniscabiei TaxID=2746961 RepID=UPI0029B6A237|nr:hypothetical protein [Streptomyces caniscabiei]MDX2776456.1 hypothetical protein [Streptomyces caniscabiei]